MNTSYLHPQRWDPECSESMACEPCFTEQICGNEGSAWIRRMEGKERCSNPSLNYHIRGDLESQKSSPCSRVKSSITTQRDPVTNLVSTSLTHLELLGDHGSWSQSMRTPHSTTPFTSVAKLSRYTLCPSLSHSLSYWHLQKSLPAKEDANSWCFYKGSSAGMRSCHPGGACKEEGLHGFLVSIYLQDK